jgi:regulator of replication initiation timing
VDVALITGVAAIITGVGGILLAIREVRRRERRSAQRNIEEFEHQLNECQAENVKLHMWNYGLRTRLADEGIEPPEPP